MKESGSTTKHMARALISTWMALSTPASGTRTNKMDMASKIGPTALATKELINMARSTERAHLSGQTTACSSANFTIITYTARASTCGATVVSTKATGRSTKCMEAAPSRGATAAATWASTSTTAKTVTASSSGPMEGRIKVIGLTASNMVKACTKPHRANRSLESGVKANGLDGSFVIRCNERLRLKFIII